MTNIMSIDVKTTIVALPQMTPMSEGKMTDLFYHPIYVKMKLILFHDCIPCNEAHFTWSCSNEIHQSNRYRMPTKQDFW